MLSGNPMYSSRLTSLSTAARGFCTISLGSSTPVSSPVYSKRSVDTYTAMYVPKNTAPYRLRSTRNVGRSPVPAAVAAASATLPATLPLPAATLLAGLLTLPLPLPFFSPVSLDSHRRAGVAGVLVPTRHPRMASNDRTGGGRNPAERCTTENNTCDGRAANAEGLREPNVRRVKDIKDMVCHCCAPAHPPAQLLSALFVLMPRTCPPAPRVATLGALSCPRERCLATRREPAPRTASRSPVTAAAMSQAVPRVPEVAVACVCVRSCVCECVRAFVCACCVCVCVCKSHLVGASVLQGLQLNSAPSRSRVVLCLCP
eukprot:m.162603 g.162603  ORF g.162603 m.162603 type:complete len:316 (-) comp17668_c1_seq1:131-1078(-)